MDSTNYVNNLTYPADTKMRGPIKEQVVGHALTTALYGQKTGHPDDAERLTTRFTPRHLALTESDVLMRKPIPHPRELGFLAAPKITFHKFGHCPRKDFRARWRHTNSWYRTTEEQVRSRKFWHTVRELLPGEFVHKDSGFLHSFATSVKEEGFMSFDTEREVHPVMSQVKKKVL